MSEPLIYQDGALGCRGELHRPDGAANGRAVLVVHEADGIGGNVRRRAAQFADLGYAALVADLYGEGRTFDGDSYREPMMALRNNPPAFRRRVQAGVNALAGAAGVGPERIAAVGYCFGGLAVLELARGGAPVAAVASFHGLLTSPAPAGPGAIRAKVFAATGALDPLVPPADVAAFQAEMGEARADWQLHVYGPALHSFTNVGVAGSPDPRMDYHAPSDRQSWAAMLAFFAEAFA